MNIHQLFLRRTLVPHNQYQRTNRKFMEQTDAIFEKKNTMGVIEQLAEIRHREGIELGREEGKEKEREEFGLRYADS